MTSCRPKFSPYLSLSESGASIEIELSSSPGGTKITADFQGQEVQGKGLLDDKCFVFFSCFNLLQSSKRVLRERQRQTDRQTDRQTEAESRQEEAAESKGEG